MTAKKHFLTVTIVCASLPPFKIEEAANEKSAVLPDCTYDPSMRSEQVSFSHQVVQESLPDLGNIGLPDLLA